MKKKDARDRLAKLVKDPQFARGHKIRNEVMGPRIVERDMAVRLNDDFQRPMWELGIRTAWGMLWTRPGLSRRDRSLLNIGMMVAMQVEHELKTHVRAAVHNGLTEEEIREALLHTALYAGLPKGTAAFRWAKTVLDEPETRKLLKKNGRKSGGGEHERRAAAGRRKRDLR